jgi:hypothetical protein
MRKTAAEASIKISKRQKLVAYVRGMMNAKRIDTAYLSVPDEAVTDEWLHLLAATKTDRCAPAQQQSVVLRASRRAASAKA